jgi:cysteine-S-conjugate beta-lyase
MTRIDHDRRIDRRLAADCKKWHLYGPGVLPMWVADMDFAVAEPIVDALRARIAHPVFGYAQAPAELAAAIIDWLAEHHDWRIVPEDLVFLPGVEPGFNMALKAFLNPGDGVVVQTPMYKPILAAPGHWGLKRIDAPLALAEDGFAMDPAVIDAAIGQARALLFCNPHNPTGKVFSQEELAVIAASCERHDVLIISDEIHCDLAFGGRRHRPIATLAPGIADRTITLMSASKTFNIAGLKTAFAVITSPALRNRFQEARLGMVDSVNIMGLEATRAAFREGEPWRRQTLSYLEANRSHLAHELKQRFPGIAHHPPDASFLAWLDCSALNLAPSSHDFFLQSARVGLSAGADFGPGAAGHIRLNFGCTRATLDEALDRMERALSRA